MGAIPKLWGQDGLALGDESFTFYKAAPACQWPTWSPERYCPLHHLPSTAGPGRSGQSSYPHAAGQPSGSKRTGCLLNLSNVLV